MVDKKKNQKKLVFPIKFKPLPIYTLTPQPLAAVRMGSHEADEQLLMASCERKLSAAELNRYGAFRDSAIRSGTMLRTFFQDRFTLWLLPLFMILILWGSPAITVAKEEHQTFSFRILLSEKKCQIAIWLTDEQGVFVDTVYVTRKIATKGLGNRRGGLDDNWGGPRLSSLPVWAYSRGVDYGNGNFYPPKNKPLPDAITSATPKAGQFLWKWKPKKALASRNYFYYVEVNKSFDKNEHHNYSWYRCQPSVIWRGVIQVGNQISKSEAKIIGHGHVAGEDGSINSDLSKLTTALDLIEKVKVVYHP